MSTEPDALVSGPRRTSRERERPVRDDDASSEIEFVRRTTTQSHKRPYGHDASVRSATFRTPTLRPHLALLVSRGIAHTLTLHRPTHTL